MMKRTMKTGAALAGIAAMAACATPYQQAAGPEDDGYRSSQVSEDVYRIVFEGNDSTSRQTVETYLLYRAAQVAENTGHDYFAVTSRDTNADVDLETYGGYTPYTTVPGYYGYGFGPGVSYPYYTAYPYGPGYTGWQAGGTTVDVDDSYTAVAFIELYEQRPGGTENLYEASEVIDRLEDEIEQPDGGVL